MQKVFVLQHSYEQQGCDETKFIGVYSSEYLAQEAIKRLQTKPGFRDRPKGFYIDKYELDKDNWIEGYVSIINIQTKDIDGNWRTVQAEKLIDGNFKIIEKYENHLLGEFKDEDIVKCEVRNDEIYAVSKVK